VPESKHQYVDGFPQPKKKEVEEDYVEFGYQLEPEYTEEELRQMPSNNENSWQHRHSDGKGSEMHFEHEH
jgi:hypothetical protein